MTFLTPIWLLALLPWAAFSVWTWMGRRRRRFVPFLELWNAPEELRRPRRGIEPPPIGLLLALLAMLLGIMAMSQPVVRLGTDRGRVTIIVDRGASMSATANAKPRFANLADQTASPLLQQLGFGKVDLVDVVGGTTAATDRSDWSGLVQGWKRTAVDSSDMLRASMREQVEQGRPTIVLSDRDLGIVDPQLVQVKPAEAVHNTGIIALAQRPGQVMVTLRSNESAARTLRLKSGNQSFSVAVKLEAGAEQNVFVDLQGDRDMIEASLEGNDDFEADDRAWLVRRRSWPSVESRIGLSDELRRMIEIYSHHRPPGDASARVFIAAPGALKGDEAGVSMAPVVLPEQPHGLVQTSAHAVAAGVDWSAVGQGVALAQQPPGEGWTRIAWIGDRTIVAVRDAETRQVWVGFESRPFERTPGFVIFWTNALDWISGQGGDEFAAQQISAAPANGQRLLPEQISGDIDGSRWPGVFETAAGKLAINAGNVPFTHDPSNAWAAQLSRLRLKGANEIPLDRWLALAALLLVLAAIATWEKKRPRTPTFAKPPNSESSSPLRQDSLTV
jgi:hypothetical protein